MIKHEFFRFLCVGLTNTLFSYVVYCCLLGLLVPYQVAYTAAYVLGIGLSYFLNSKWVFKVGMTFKTFMQFPLVYVVQYLVNIVLLHILVETVSLPEWEAPFAVIMISFPLTYFGFRFLLKELW